jgi:glycosidase
MYGRLLCWGILFLAGSPLAQAAKPAAPTTLRSGPLSVTLDPQTGGLAEIRYGEALLGRLAPGVAPLDLREQEKWIVGGGVPLELLDVQSSDEKTAVATARAGDWQIAVRYALDATWPMLTRSAKLTWLGKGPTKLKGFWLGSPTFTAAQGAYYYSPGDYPPKRFATEAFQAGASHSFHRSLSPLIVQLAPERSLLWISDELTSASDHTSVTASGSDGGLRVRQGFEVMARMQPGDSQQIGSASLWVLPCDGEAALLRIHDWMRRRGHVPPADRPEWFRDAILYSYHPGGTTGSNFHDLGGFVPATRLLDHVAALGCNAVWIMPIEDAGPYQPRDYYKLQAGLGTEQEYRALVARAHQLGLHVLQDCVPHGGRNDSPRAKQHPEWLAYEEDGSTLSYWCYDFNWPTWREYMAGVARHYVTQFDVDGYRVDAVGGSRIPNWNAKIPYARASFAQLQGGLNMLRSLREAVKQSKPHEGGLLAEVQGSVYGTAADAVYDFTGCYQAFQDLRKLPPEEFVPQLRRWLHEQQYAETPDLLRLRHVESHDSLRAELWYGVQPMRAMMALSAWIHGIPLVYHEGDNGHEAAFRRIFAIRKRLAELSRGTADYLSVETPPTVFACLRCYQKQASLVLINLASEPIDATAAVPAGLLPASLRAAPAITVLRPDGEETVRGSLEREKLRIPVRLKPFEYVVCALRPASEAIAGVLPKEAVAAASVSRMDQPVFDPRTGLLDGLKADGEPLLGQVDLYLPAGSQRELKRAIPETSGKETICRYRLGKSTLELRYEPQADGLHLHTQWQGDVPDRAALYLPMAGARQWAATTAEGPLAGEYLVRHRVSDAIVGSIYWRPQGTNVIYDSLIHPLSPSMSRALVATGRKTFQIGFPGSTPARVEWLDRLGSQEQLGALVAWSDPQVPGDPRCRNLEIVIGVPAAGAKPAWPAGLRPDAGGWIYENRHYRLRLARCGMITQLCAKTPTLRTIVDRADLYTDHGYSGEAIRFGASNDVEAASRIWSDDQGNLRLRFEGRLRGFQRFELLKPPIEYYADYTLGSTASLRVSYGVRAHADPSGKSAFLALMSPLPEVGRAVFKSQGRVLYEGSASDGKTRGWQSRSQRPAALPDEIELSSETLRLLRLTGLSSDGVPLCNTFVQGHNFFLAWLDGPPPPAAPRQWRGTSAVWTVGDAEPCAIGHAPQITSAAGNQGLLDDPGFEQAMTLRPVSLRTGEPLPGPVSQSAWLAPAGGRIVASPVHRGKAAAEVTNPSGDYALWRQPLAVTVLKAGTRLRLSAWVKGQGIRQGDAGWKVGEVRFAVVTGKTQYVSSPPLVGSFDWKKTSVELTVPEGLRSLNVEAGLNGATGTIWIDDVEVVVE